MCFSELLSCSEDGSVRMWEIQDLPLPAEPASPGDAHSHTQYDFCADEVLPIDWQFKRWFSNNGSHTEV